MTQSRKNLIRKNETLTGIRSIVHSMKTLSAINVLPYEQAARAIDAYHDIVLDGIQAFLRHNGPLALRPNEAEAQVIIAFGSDHGLCGSYNETLAKKILNMPKTKAPANSTPRVICVGARMEDALSGLGITAEKSLWPPAAADGLGRLASDVVTCLDEICGVANLVEVEITLVFTEHTGGGQQAPVTRRLLPFDDTLLKELTDRPWQSTSLPVFNLPPEELLASLIRDYLFACIYRAAAEALVTENAARLALMQQAEQSVDERLEVLKRETQMERQDEITAELLDVIIGFETFKRRTRGAGATQPAGD